MSKVKRHAVLMAVALLGGGALATRLARGVAPSAAVQGMRPGTHEPASRRRSDRDGIRPPEEVFDPAPRLDGEARTRAEKQQEDARAAAEVERLTAAVGLTEQQRGRAARVVSVVEHIRTMVGRDPDQDQDARSARNQQVDQQERLALMAVVSSPQQSLLDAYFRTR